MYLLAAITQHAYEIHRNSCTDDNSPIQCLNGPDSNLIVKFQFLQSILLQSRFGEYWRPDDSILNQIRELAKELVESVLAHIERLELDTPQEYSAEIDYRMQSKYVKERGAKASINPSKFAKNRVLIQERRVMYESRILSTIGATCVYCPSLGNLLLKSSLVKDEIRIESELNEISAKETFVYFLTKVLTHIGYSVSIFQKL